MHIHNLLIFCLIFLTSTISCHPQSQENKIRETFQTPSSQPNLIFANKRVLLIHSYYRDYEWVTSITRGIRRSFENTGISLEVFYMDTKRKTSVEWKIHQGTTAKRIIAEWKPEVVILADDNAQQYVGASLAGKKTPQIVFCGVNNTPENYGYPAINVTGLLERPHFINSLELMKNIAPKTQKVAVISDTSPTSKGAISHLKSLKTQFEIVSWKLISSFSEWKDIVVNSQNQYDTLAIYTYHTILDASGNRMKPRDVIAWTTANTNVPTIGFFSFSIDDGLLAGVVESGFEHGFEAGGLVLRILSGERTDTIPIRIAQKKHSMLNTQTLSKLKLEIPTKLLSEIDIITTSYNDD